MRIISLFILCILITSCNKPDAQPELRDPIYQDLVSLLAENKQSTELEKKQLDEHQQALKEVIPQTGQIKFAQKRVFESMAKINRLNQEGQYLELKIEARKQESRDSYLKAFKEGGTWPNPQEWTSYQAEKRLRASNKSWDYKERIDSFNGRNEKAQESIPSSH